VTALHLEHHLAEARNEPAAEAAGESAATLTERPDERARRVERQRRDAPVNCAFTASRTAAQILREGALVMGQHFALRQMAEA